MLKEIITSILVGVLGIIIINLIGSFFAFHIPFNIWTVLLFGFFRLPGLIFILVILLL